MAAAWLLGTAFVLLQGREWCQLLGDGLTMRSIKLGAFFYLIVGWLFRRSKRVTSRPE